MGSKARKHVPQGGQVKIFNDKNYLKAVKVIWISFIILNHMQVIILSIGDNFIWAKLCSSIIQKANNLSSGKMYEEEKRNRDNSRNRDKAQPPGGRPNYYQVPNRNYILVWTYLNFNISVLW